MASHVLIDSNVWLGVFDESDSLHRKSEKALQAVNQQNSQVIITNFILQEIFTVLNVKKSGLPTDAIMDVMMNNSSFVPFDIDRFWMKEMFAFASEYDKKGKLSLVDISNIVLAKNFGCELLSFDKYLMKLYKKVAA